MRRRVQQQRLGVVTAVSRGSTEELMAEKGQCAGAQLEGTGYTCRGGAQRISNVWERAAAVLAIAAEHLHLAESQSGALISQLSSIAKYWMRAAHSSASPAKACD